jgi:hypothetical protein
LARGYIYIRELILTSVYLHFKEEMAMRKLFYGILLAAVLGLLVLSCQKPSNPLDATAAHQRVDGSLAKATENIIYPYEQRVWVPCAAGGAGEWLNISGRLHLLFCYTENNNQLSAHLQMQAIGLSGVGETTGDTYHATGMNKWSWSGALPYVDGEMPTEKYQQTFVNNFRMIGVGSAVNYTVHDTWLLKINANLTWTVDISHDRVECN